MVYNNPIDTTTTGYAMKAFAHFLPTTEATETSQRWSFCYLHGMAEFADGEMSNSDIFVADVPKPDAGNYPVTVNGFDAIAVIRNVDGFISGRVALLSDTFALAHCLTGDWE